MLNYIQNKLIFFKTKSKNDVFKNMSILAIGVGSAQIIGIAVAPILTRMYTPENFGVLAVFMAAVGVMTPFTTLRYTIPIPLLKKDGVAINIFVMTIIILLIVTSITTISLALYADVLFDLFSINILISCWWLLPIALFGSGLYEILNSWAIRQKDFKAISKTRIYQSIGAAFIKITLGLLEMKSRGLLIGNVLSSIFVAFLLIVSNFKSISINIKYIRMKRIEFLLKRYIEYPKYRLPSQFILVLSIQAPLLFLAAFFGADVVGYFGLTMMVLSVPSSLLGNTTGQAYYAEIADIGRKNPEKIYELTKDVTTRLFLFSLIPFIILFFASPWIFSIVFGENWREAGEYASIMSFYMLTSFISSPLVNALSVFEDQLLFFKINVYRLLLLVSLFSLTWSIDLDPKQTIFWYSIVMSVFFLSVNIIVFNVIKKEIKKRTE